MLTKELSRNIRIGVLRGGSPAGYNDSLETGNFVIQTLLDSHKPVDIFISPDGVWHMNGVPKSPENIFKHIDVVWNGLHDDTGQDILVGDFLRHHNISHTGSTRYELGLAMNRWLTKEHLKNLGIKTPIGILVRESDSINDKAKEIWGSIPTPIIIKPAKGGYTSAYYKADFYQELIQALEDILSKHDSAIAEEYLHGTRASSGVIEGFRNEKLYSLTPVEVRGDDIPVYPTRFDDEIKREIERLSRAVHNGLGLRHYSTVDFLVTPRRGIYVLEVCSQPRLGAKSVIKKSLEAVGVGIKDFIKHVLSLALNRG